MTFKKRLAVGFGVLVGIGIATMAIQIPKEAETTNVRVANSVKVTHLLTPNEWEELGLAWDSGVFDVTAEGNLLVLADGRIYEIELSRGALVADAASAPNERIDSFALDGGGTVLVVAGAYLGQVESDASISRAIPLPWSDMRIAGSIAPGRMYLFGGPEAQRRIYLFENTGAIVILAELPEVIVSVADSSEAVYLATRTTVYRLVPARLEVVLRDVETALAGPLTSIAVSGDDKIVFIASAKQVLSLQEGAGFTLVSNAGGKLKWRNEGLHVWDKERRLMFRVERKG